MCNSRHTRSIFYEPCHIRRAEIKSSVVLEELSFGHPENPVVCSFEIQSLLNLWVSIPSRPIVIEVTTLEFTRACGRGTDRRKLTACIVYWRTRVGEVARAPQGLRILMRSISVPATSFTHSSTEYACPSTMPSVPSLSDPALCTVDQTAA